MHVIEVKSFEFAIKIVELYKFLSYEKKEHVLSKQLLRSGTSIGANVAEAEDGISKPEFIAKMSIALKEANETLYWLRLLAKTNYLDDYQDSALVDECFEIRRLLAKIVKSAKENLEKESKN